MKEPKALEPEVPEEFAGALAEKALVAGAALLNDVVELDLGKPVVVEEPVPNPEPNVGEPLLEAPNAGVLEAPKDGVPLVPAPNEGVVVLVEEAPKEGAVPNELAALVADVPKAGADDDAPNAGVVPKEGVVEVAAPEPNALEEVPKEGALKEVVEAPKDGVVVEG